MSSCLLCGIAARLPVTQLYCWKYKQVVQKNKGYIDYSGLNPKEDLKSTIVSRQGSLFEC